MISPSSLFTFMTWPTCWSTLIKRWMIPSPPCWAIAAAVWYSVTVSMLAEMIGIASLIFGVSWAEVSTSLREATPERWGIKRTSSKVSPSPAILAILFRGFDFGFRLQKYDRGNGVPFVHPHQVDSLGRPAQYRYLFDRQADYLSFLRHQQQVILLDFLDDPSGNQLSGFGGDAVGQNAGTSPALGFVFGEAGALAAPPLGDREKIILGIGHDFGGDNLVPLAQLDSPHSRRRPSHRAHVLLFEANRLSHFGHQRHIIFSVGGFDPNQILPRL